MPLPDSFDHERLETAKTYAGKVLLDLDTEALHLTLERLPYCATDADSENKAKPLNVVDGQVTGNSSAASSNCYTSCSVYR